jgi:hypothetical protein
MNRTALEPSGHPPGISRRESLELEGGLSELELPCSDHLFECPAEPCRYSFIAKLLKSWLKLETCNTRFLYQSDPVDAHLLLFSWRFNGIFLSQYKLVYPIIKSPLKRPVKLNKRASTRSLYRPVQVTSIMFLTHCAPVFRN